MMRAHSRSTPRVRNPPAAGLPPDALPAGTSGRILQKALRLFARDGFHGTSVRDLARQCRLQPGALYVHFPSKEHILAELARLGHEVHHAAIRRELLQAGDDPAEQLRALVRAHAALHANYPQLAVVVNEELHALPAQLAAPALALRQQSAALLLDVLQRGVTAGRFAIGNLQVTAAAIGAIGLRIPYWYTPGGDLAVEDLAQQHADLALRMVGFSPSKRRS